jgi:hypothetical protein
VVRSVLVVKFCRGKGKKEDAGEGFVFKKRKKGLR